MSPELAGRFFTTSGTWEAPYPSSSHYMDGDNDLDGDFSSNDFSLSSNYMPSYLRS